MPAEIKQPEGYICVGGPYAGRRVATHQDHPRFIAAIGENDPYPSDRPLPTLTYYLFEIGGDGDHFRVWRPEGQSPRETIALMIEAYSRDVSRMMAL